MRKSDVLQLLISLPRLGIRPATYWQVAKQLLSERRSPERVVRRRNIQALLSFDVCMTQIRRQRPQFCTVFANHVAAAMHRYWAARFPDHYEENRMPENWRKTYSDEIDAAVRDTDLMLKQLAKFVEGQPDYTLLVLSSMGQAAIEHQVVRNQLIIKNLDTFMNCMSFSADKYEILPGMGPEYVVRFNSSDDCTRFNEMLGRLIINGIRPDVNTINEFQTRFLVFQYNVEFDTIALKGEGGAMTTFALQYAGMHIEPIQDLTGSTAQHIPEGCCFVYDGKADLSHVSKREQRVDLCAVSASILAACDTSVPEYMPPPVPALVSALTHSRQVPKHREKSPAAFSSDTSAAQSSAVETNAVTQTHGWTRKGTLLLGELMRSNKAVSRLPA